MLGHPHIQLVEIRRLYNPGPGRHWFDADTIAFFNTMLPGLGVQTEHGNYFVTRETNPSGVSRFTVRRQDPDNGDIGTLGEFHCYDTFAEASQALRAHLRSKQGAQHAG